ncbi:hypothetical protein DsansV1_C22g0170401 [Dioscorea sansibarensis]
MNAKVGISDRVIPTKRMPKGEATNKARSWMYFDECFFTSSDRKWKDSQEDM